MKTSTAIEAFLKELLSLNYSDRTIKGYKQDLRMFEKMLNADNTEIQAISQNDIEAFLSKGKKGQTSSSYRNRRLSCLKSFFGFLENKQLIIREQNPTTLLKFARVTNKKPSPLFYAEYLSILEAVKQERNVFLRKRNWAIIVMLYNTGLRLSELAGLNIEQVDFKEARLIGVKRKGNRIVDLPINMNVIVALNNWLKERTEKMNEYNNDTANSEQALFITGRRTRISTRMIEWLVKGYAKNTGIARSITPHTFRHSYCTEIQKRGAGMYVAKELLDHHNIKTTSRYSHANESAMRKAVDSLIDSKQWLDE